jgi:transcriptional regulator with PAS, ATPase and Fis domain
VWHFETVASVHENPLIATTRSRSQAGGPARDERLLRGIVGATPRMQRIFRLVSKVARTESTVLITGESGTGKELIARSIHLQSRRAQGPFVPVNIGAVPESLLESELFGAARGAYTGAAADRAGLVEAADRGTLFLDEVGDMPLPTQVKLLRTLENGEVRRLGDQQLRLVDVRVIAATHRDLQEEVAAGRFRADLYYRLNVVGITLPPLRERREDIGLLASYFLETIGAREGRAGLAFSPEVRAALERYDYPGNVRELQNAVAHAIAVAEGELIEPHDLPAALLVPRLLPRQEPVAATEAAPAGVAQASRDQWSLADVEKEHIARVLARHHGNTTTAARQLGISRTTLWRKLRRYGLKRLAE